MAALYSIIALPRNLQSTEQNTNPSRSDLITVEIRNEPSKDMVETFPGLKSVYHILTQHKLNHAVRHQHTIHALRAEERLHDLYLYRPGLIKLLTVEQKKAFLGIANNTAYYRAKYYLEKKIKKSE